MPDAAIELTDSIADTVRLVAQGGADAIVENIDFFMEFTKNHPDIAWRVVDDPIFVAYCAVGVAQGNDHLREVLDTALYDLHSSGAVDEAWQTHYGAPTLRGVQAGPFF